MQQKRKAEREQKKKEREEKKKEMEEKRRQREAEKSKKGQGRKRMKNFRPKTRRRLHLESLYSDDEVTQESPAPEESLALESDSSAGSESDREPETSLVLGPNRLQCCAILPARFREDSDGDDGVVCDICHMTEPVNMASETVFWVDCDTCGVWVHNYCAL